MTELFILGVIGLPLSGSLLALLLRWQQGMLVLGGQLLGLMAAVMLLLQATSLPMSWNIPLGIPGYPFQLLLTRQSAVIAVTVALVGLLVSLFALGYMKGAPAQTRFWSTFSGFVVAMQIFVLAGDWILLLIGWELMSLASFLLIGFYNQRPDAVHASRRAFMTTRVGDIGLYLAALLLVSTAKTSFLPSTLHVVSRNVAIVAAIGLLVAGAVKAAQFPFDGWLRDAMAGPTPVSALLHSATMVAAGFLLLLKVQPLLTPTLSLMVALVGGVTGVVAGVIAFAQTDLKRMLAASTSSQLGFMLLALGAGSPSAALLFFIAQAFMKSSLFMAAGTFQHAAGSTQFKDLRGLGRVHPWMYGSFVVAGLGLAAVPPLAGFWSKDAVVASAFTSSYRNFLVPLVLGGALMTGLYIAKAIWLLGVGQKRGSAIKGLPMMATGLFGAVFIVVVFGFVVSEFERFTKYNLPHAGLALPAGLAISLIGLALGVWQAAKRPMVYNRFSSAAATGFYASQSLDKAAARMMTMGSTVIVRSDRGIEDGITYVAHAVTATAIYTDNKVEQFFQDVIDGIASYAGRIGERLRSLQSGLVHRELKFSFYVAGGLVVIGSLIITIKGLI